MKNCFYLILLTYLSCSNENSVSQNTEILTSKKALEVDTIVFNKTIPWMGYYLAVEPSSDKIDNVLILLHGYSQKAETLFQETTIEEEASANNILTIAMAVGTKITADSTVVSNLDKAFEDIIKRYNLKSNQFVLGGFSAGGVAALRYAELCNEFPDQHPIKIKAVFGVDPPVDIFGIWEYFEREVKRNFSDEGVNEAKFVMRKAEQEYGTPHSNREKYLELTPFYAGAEEPGNERFLYNTPVRMYQDIDIPWLLSERQRSAFDGNFLYTSELIARLIRQGNKKAEFIQVREKGYRSNGTRHPHSWSIVDARECIDWIQSL